MHSCCHRRRLPGTNWQHSWLCLCVFLMWIFFFLKKLHCKSTEKKTAGVYHWLLSCQKSLWCFFFALIALYVRLETQYCEKAYDDLHIYMCNQYISNVFISIFVLYLDISVRKKWFWWSRSLGGRRFQSVCQISTVTSICCWGVGGSNYIHSFISGLEEGCFKIHGSSSDFSWLTSLQPMMSQQMAHTDTCGESVTQTTSTSSSMGLTMALTPTPASLWVACLVTLTFSDRVVETKTLS